MWEPRCLPSSSRPGSHWTVSRKSCSPEHIGTTVTGHHSDLSKSRKSREKTLRSCPSRLLALLACFLCLSRLPRSLFFSPPLFPFTLFLSLVPASFTLSLSALIFERRDGQRPLCLKAMLEGPRASFLHLNTAPQWREQVPRVIICDAQGLGARKPVHMRPSAGIGAQAPAHSHPLRMARGCPGRSSIWEGETGGPLLAPSQWSWPWAPPLVQRRLPPRLLGAVGPGRLASAGWSFCGLLKPAELLFASGHLTAAGRAKLPGENPRNCFGWSFLLSWPTLGSLGWLRRGTLGSEGKESQLVTLGCRPLLGHRSCLSHRDLFSGYLWGARTWASPSWLPEVFHTCLFLESTSSLPALLWSWFLSPLSSPPSWLFAQGTLQPPPRVVPKCLGSLIFRHEALISRLSTP